MRKDHPTMNGKLRVLVVAIAAMGSLNVMAWQNWTGNGDGVMLDSGANWSNGQIPSYATGGTAAGSLGIGIATGVLKLGNDLTIDRLQITDNGSHVFDIHPHALGTWGQGGLAICFVKSGGKLKLASGKIDVQPGRGIYNFIAVPSSLNVARSNGPIGEFQDCVFEIDGPDSEVYACDGFYMNHGTNNLTVVSGGAYVAANLQLGNLTTSLANEFRVTGFGTVFSNTYAHSSQLKLFMNSGSSSNRFVLANGARLERVSPLEAHGGVGNSIIVSNGTYAIDTIGLVGGKGQQLLFKDAAVTFNTQFLATSSAYDSAVVLKDSALTNRLAGGRGPSLSIGHDLSGSNNTFRLDHSRFDYSQYQYLGYKGPDNAVIIENGSEWNFVSGGSGACFVGLEVSARRSSLVVRDSSMYVATLYGGYEGADALVRVEGNSRFTCTFAYCCNPAAPAKGGGNRWEILDGAYFWSSKGSAFHGSGNRLVVSNATFTSSGAMVLSQTGSGNAGLEITVAGVDAVLSSNLADDEAIHIGGNAKMRFIVPENGYADWPVRTTAKGGVLTVEDGVTAEFDLEAFKSGKKRTTPVMRAVGGTLAISSATFGSFASSVDAASRGTCELVLANNSLFIRKIYGFHLHLR